MELSTPHKDFTAPSSGDRFENDSCSLNYCLLVKKVDQSVQSWLSNK